MNGFSSALGNLNKTDEQDSKIKQMEPSMPTVKMFPKVRKESFVEVFPAIEEEQKRKSSKENVKTPLERRTSNIGSVRRNSSVSSLSGSPPRKSFKALGGKVTSLVRARMAFQRKPKTEPENDAEEPEEIEDLPKEPRFSSSLSPEAQFAMMKGYEDAVYNYLCKSYPEYRALLRRSRTPVNPVEMKDEKKDKTEKTDASHISNGQDTLPTENGSVGQRSDFDLSNLASSIGEDTERHASPKRSLSVSSIKSNSSTESRRLSRANSVPSVSKQKQLVMTHRLQSAMDILDTVKGNLGLHPISPRIKGSNTKEIKPVADYNKWTKVWNGEFMVSPGKSKA